MKKKYKISVLVITCNHSKYIAKALNSILEQKGDFELELLVGVDASIDDTAEQVRELEESNSNMRVFYHDDNVGMVSNINFIRREATGDFLAILEGDDFWNDQFKLKEQLSFLLENDDYSCICSKFNIVDIDERPLKEVKILRYFEGDVYAFEDYQRGYLPSHTSTLFYRNYFLDNKELLDKFEKCDSIGDKKIAMLLSYLGKIKILDELLTSYRYVTSNSQNWTARTKEKNMCLHYLDWIFECERLLSEVSGDEIIEKDNRLFVCYFALVKIIKGPSASNIRVFLTVINKSNTSLFKLFKYVTIKIISKFIRKNKRG